MRTSPVGWRRTASKSLRVGIVASVLFGLVVVTSLVGTNDSLDRRVLETGPTLPPKTSTECFTAYPEFCSNETTCVPPKDFLFACCKNDTVPVSCVTFHLETCKQEDLCTAELVPGGNGAAECLKTWENGLVGGLAYGAMLLWLFLGIAIVCDEYFVTALEQISEGLGLSPDVAGATFMAAGSSAPELFVSLADNVISNPPKSIGLGTILGSAIFNVLIIIGMSALLAGQRLKVDWKPLTRDTIFYLSATGLLVVFVLDERIVAWEAGVLMACYAVYIVFMKYNSRIMQWVDSRFGSVATAGTELAPAASDDIVLSSENPKHPSVSKDKSAADSQGAHSDSTARSAPDQEDDVFSAGHAPNPIQDSSNRVSWSRKSSRRLSISSKTSTNAPTGGIVTTVSLATLSKVEEGEEKQGADEEEQGGYWDSLLPPDDSTGLKYCFDLIYYVLSLPFLLLYRISIPDCTFDVFGEDKPGKTQNRRFAYWLSFFLCVAWIAVISQFLVYCGSKFGCAVGLDPAIVGLTVLAAGTSVPDTISSVIVARKGQGDMAISNAIGSNVFNILVGLGLPWFLATAVVYREREFVVNTDGLFLSVGFIVGLTVVLTVILHLSKWTIGAKEGLLLFLLYVGYVSVQLYVVLG